MRIFRNLILGALSLSVKALICVIARGFVAYAYWEYLMQWFKEWKQRRKVARFNRGYHYAMKEVRSGLHSQPLLYLHGMVEESMMFGDYDEFDKGVEKALNELDPSMDYLKDDRAFAYQVERR